MDLLIDLAAEVKVSTTRARGASRSKRPLATLKLLARNLNQIRSQVKRSKKGAQPNLPTEVALPAPDSKGPAKRTRKALTKGVKKIG